MTKLQKSGDELAKLLDKAHTAAQQNIPAGQLRDQVPSRAVPPATSTSKGGVSLSDDDPEPLGTPDPGSGLAVSHANHVHGHGDLAGGTLHAVATDSVAGFMSAADKAKEDGYPDLAGLTPGYVLTALTSTTADFAPVSGGGGLPVGAVGDMISYDTGGTAVIVPMAGVAEGSALYAVDIGGEIVPAWDIRQPHGAADGDLANSYPDPIVIGLQGRPIDGGAPNVGETFIWDGSLYALTPIVTSVGITAPAEISVTNSPITSTGDIALTWANATANRVFAGPTTGSPGTPAFRALVAADIPDLSAVYQPLDADLTALAALSGTGIAARTAANTWAQRTLTGTTNRLSVTNGNGVSGNPTLDISTNYAGQSTIDTVGTISSGDWRGTPITVGYGGTGLTSYAVGDLIYASAGTTLSKLADVATGNVLLSGGVTTAPAYGKVGLTTHVSGLLGQANGGVGADLSATGGAGQYLKQISSGAAITVGAIPATDLTYSGLTTGQIFQATGAGAAGFAALNLATAASITGILPSANGGTGVNNGSNLLTVPATGTAALRDVANTFTAAEIVNVTDAATAGNTTLMTFAHNSSGTPAVGFGSDISWLLGDSTTPNTAAALIRTSWATATHGSQKAQLSFFVYDTAARNAFRLEASGTAAMVGFMGAAPVTRPNITGVSSGTPTAAQQATVIRNILTALSSLGLATDSTT